MKIKIEKHSDNINPFGGINFTNQEIKESGILEVIDNELGTRPAQATYQYSDILLNLWNLFLCGGDCAEDINVHLKPHLESIPDLKLANADTILRVLKSLAVDNQKVTSSTGNTYEINHNEAINRLNIRILTLLGMLKSGCYYDYDYDNEVLPTEKYDAKNTYKKNTGYFPGMATICGAPVHFENRDGNMNVKTGQADVLSRSYAILKEFDIKIDRSRMDAGSYSREIVETVEKNSCRFYIRANRCEQLTEQLKQVEHWETVEINNIKYEVCSIDYQPFKYSKDEIPKTYRLVISREETNEKQLNLFTGDNMKYRSILTNDYNSSNKEVIEYYNQRGTEERTIDELNNDFGWNKMPFSFMAENTVFLMVMMICKNIYTWLIGRFATKLDWLKKNFRLKKFIFRFIVVPSKWRKRSGQQILRIYSEKSYELLLI